MTCFQAVPTNMTKFWQFLLVGLLLCTPMAHAQIRREDEGPLKALQDKYDELPNGAKVATAAVAGFVTSRVALKTFVSVAKVAGAAFIA
jgi:hypothetical protein